MKTSFYRSVSLLLCTALLALPLFATGTVYLVLGSDTAIWDGMSVNRYHPHYSLVLYTDPAQNAYKVMDPAWRARYMDSYGSQIKFTWWMMAGDIFRYADNTNVPVPNIMTLYLMKKYHGDRVRQFGDELSMHYHTFAWTDYDGDGKYYWNQAHGFDECRDDFDVTLAQFLLEENTYPVSFRSGWHYMDNSWQHYLNTLLPYSMHDDYPAKRYVTTEPIDNNYDWSLSSALWVPFRPSEANYQLGGGSKGWNLRSKHVGSVTQTIMNGMFSEASKGTDQMACLWGHLPEEDFLTNMAKIDSLAHAAEKAYPGVKFRYCTAVEAMQRWRGSQDTTSPALTFTSDRSGETLTFTIRTNEPIFQVQPFVALKDLYERDMVLACTKTGENTWTAVSPVAASLAVKAAVALTDTMGNLSTARLTFLPDDIYLDNLDAGYTETRGAWTTTTNSSWGTDARQAVLAENDSAMSAWSAVIPQTANYNFFIQIPAIANAASNAVFRVKADGAVVAEKRFAQTVPAAAWIHIATQMLAAGAHVTVEQTVTGTGQAGKIAASDVVKISPLVRQHAISSSQTLVDCGEVSEADTGRVSFFISNGGIAPLSVQSVTAASSAVSFGRATPFEIPPMSTIEIPVRVYSIAKGPIADTITIKSNDELTPELKIPFTAAIEKYFTVADNDDPMSYTETGTWSNSVATDCYGKTSRFAPLGPKSRAVFKRTLLKSGIYDLQEIVPTTVNASTRARYTYKVNGVAGDTVFIDQNAGSGSWVALFRRTLHAGMSIEIEVTDASPTITGSVVLRADAVRFQLRYESAAVHDESSAARIPADYELGQNYPNPFNPSTTIRYGLPSRSRVRLEVYNTLGQRVAVLEDGAFDAGVYESVWQASGAPSGLYFLRMHAEASDGSGRQWAEVRKMMLVR